MLVEALTDAGDLALGDTQAKRLDRLVELRGRDAGDVGLLHDRDQRLLRSPPRLEEAREVAAPP
jgi:hypothetical protein